MTCLAIIPARGGSVRVPRKNIKPFRGRPIIEYSIDVAGRCGLFDAIVVTTDDDEIAELAAINNAWVVRRETDDGAKGTQEVARDVLMQCLECTMACVIYATCPLLRKSDLERGHAVLQSNRTLYSMSVQVDPLADAGCFYWGRAEAFRVRAPLIDSHTVMVPMPANRVCDINTMDDWARAESMFDALRRAA